MRRLIDTYVKELEPIAPEHTRPSLRRKNKMDVMCPYCQIDTAGNHESNCPNNPKWGSIVYTYPFSKLNQIQPFVCPVCNGNGLVPNGFYNQTLGQWSRSDTTPEKCRTCDGKGIVWK